MSHLNTFMLRNCVRARRVSASHALIEIAFVRRYVMSFTWPKGMVPTEDRWFKCLHRHYQAQVCSIENKILQKEGKPDKRATRSRSKGEVRKRNERHYQIIKEMAAQGYSNDQIARRLDITRQRLYEFRSKHKV